MNRKDLQENGIDFAVEELVSDIVEYDKSQNKQRIKYATHSRWLVHANITVHGLVESKDVIGSILKTSSAYLGKWSLDSLQTEHRVGRVEINLTKSKEKNITSGDIKIPVNHDEFVATVVAAGLKMVERIASFKCFCTIEEIEDLQLNLKIKLIKEAKLIYNTKFKTSINVDGEEAADIVDALKLTLNSGSKTKAAEVQQGVYVGKDFDSALMVYVVEGSADIEKLSSFGIYNVISCNGTEVPEIVFKKIGDKSVTLLSDADRGGSFIMEKFRNRLSQFYVVDLPPLQTIEKISRVSFFTYLKAKRIVESNKS